MTTPNNDALGSMGPEFFNPTKCLASYAVRLELQGKTLVGHRVESLVQVKVDSVHHVVFQESDPVLQDFKELSLTGASRTETILLRVQEIFGS